ncbi:hypothetical protein [Isoptericola croceus]|uniref:hypothetical protein n=1 Tax=Isoptericola croceus TaxID=3031406 RepID=UPI0023F76FD0|nr:hypothetical protein [Isoptericola croceus]
MEARAKTAAVLLGVAPAAWITYLALLVMRADGAPLSTTGYVDLVLWTIGGGIVVAVATTLVVHTRDRQAADARDREIEGRADAMGNAIVVLGALVALALALADTPSFWIANALYLTFVLAGVLSAAARLGFYRVGVPGW